MRRISTTGAFVATRTEGFEEYKKIVEGYTPESVEAITGVSAQEIRRAARMYAGAKTAAILWGMGVTQFYQWRGNRALAHQPRDADRQSG
ncbi:molybdopterin-dependent oxidoreductase [Enterobacter hormaechei]|uniref:Molybdopterin-dependent oxidoreductase n=1 Tax=Enterobacter hormaechei TaxID=158836 RepID=A0A927DHZ8_9ENTR|nr:molybdopterin-dependent oxidoreductase [Enterobacter hormaechei]